MPVVSSVLLIWLSGTPDMRNELNCWRSSTWTLSLSFLSRSSTVSAVVALRAVVRFAVYVVMIGEMISLRLFTIYEQTLVEMDWISEDERVS